MLHVTILRRSGFWYRDSACWRRFGAVLLLVSLNTEAAVKRAGCNLQTVEAPGSVEGTWAVGCYSLSRLGRYAQYYRFELATETTVQIDLTSSRDTYMFLYSNAGTAGEAVTDANLGTEHSLNNDAEDGNNNSRINSVLPAGAYTIEATTLDSRTYGDFVVSVTTPSPAG